MTYDDIDRDILASLGVHFQSAFAGYLPVFFEDQHIDSSPASNYIEVRAEAATIDEIAREQYQVTVDVDLKIVRTKTNNLLAIRSDAGKCAEAFRGGVPYRHPVAVADATIVSVYPYITVGGMTYADCDVTTEAQENQAVVLGCLDNIGFYGRRSNVKIHHYGQLKNKHLLVSTVSTRLSILL